MSTRFRFWILVSTVAISGFSQGMLLPLIAVIFENDGVNSTLNGLNATALYIGILIASPFMENPLRKYGYKPIIMTGGLMVALSLALFPVWSSFWFWFALRFIIGIGDHALHFATQTWITSFSTKDNRGRNISLYGLFFGIGFAIGPLMTPLVEINEALPFLISSLLCLIGWGFLFFLNNELPEEDFKVSSTIDTFRRFKQAWKYGWVAFLPTLGYGFLESSLNGIFPVYGLRIGLNVTNVSILLTSFAVGSIITQLPLGMLSDRLGRRNVLMIVLISGTSAFFLASLLEDSGSVIGLLICFSLAGMMVGSTFSLGISYMADLMPQKLLPTGNLLCGVSFSIGSLAGPFLGGVLIQWFEQISYFHIISSFLLIILLIIVRFGKKELAPIAEN
ncbi:MFS family permease [Bacillus mesophilus]|uniref:MFS transporter n=1 Tax=Bacillus mesophilus TaxID=1808955 RepID=A0A6M0QAH4_9BACI|nr:MFS transporter [Bacillus mesophilus]MBM7662627.1 MFS family permease [Bacillus mesophilus]NEY73305.1 MFS transporter [Bacillus mesophilus]